MQNIRQSFQKSLSITEMSPFSKFIDASGALCGMDGEKLQQQKFNCGFQVFQV